MRACIWKLAVIALAVGFVAGAGTAALAQVGEIPVACAEDAKIHCSGVRAGSGKRAACLRDNTDALSETCRTMLGTETSEDRPDYKACNGDVEMWCADVDPGEGRVRNCLRKNASVLTAHCRVYQVRIKD